MFNDHRRSSSTAECLVRWFQSFQSDIEIELDSLQSLTLNPNLDEIWRQIIVHYQTKHCVRKVKETIRIDDLKRRHPERWEQQKNVHLQQSQLEQRIQARLKEISSIRWEQSNNIHNELERVRSIVDDEKRQISSLDNQLRLYRQIFQRFDKLHQIKVQLDCLFNVNGEPTTSHDILSKFSFSDDQSSKIVNLNDFLTSMNIFIQQRINKISLLEKEKEDRNSSVAEFYDEALNKVNLEFSKQFIHLSNVRQESIKVRDRLEQTKREVIGRRSISEQNQLSSILEAMISSKSIEVHLSLLKKKVQTEIEQTNKFDDNLLTRLHQQIGDKRNQLNRIEQEFNRILQSSPVDQLDKIESKVKLYHESMVELPKRVQSLNFSHLLVSNEIRSKIFNCSSEQFNKVHWIDCDEQNSNDSMINNKLCSIQSQNPATPLKSLKQLLGIRTQENQFVETSNESISSIIDPTREQRWKNQSTDDQPFEVHLPEIGSIDWSLLSRLDRQVEDDLNQTRLDFDGYSILFENLRREIEIFTDESKKILEPSNGSSID